MAAEIFYLDTDDEPTDVGGQQVEDGHFYSVDSFGDGQGNEAFIIVAGDEIHVYEGKIITQSVDEETEEFEIKVTKNVATLKVGEKITQLLHDTNNNQMLFHVRNLGSTEIDPSLN